MKLGGFTFDNKFEAADAGAFLGAFFNDALVKDVMGMAGSGAVAEVKSVLLPSTVLSMDFFDRLDDSGILGCDGNLRKTYEDYFDGCQVS